MEQTNEVQLKMKRAELMIQLGELSYKKYRMEGDATGEVSQIAGEIETLDYHIAQVTGALNEQEGICPNCGSNVAANNDFCPSCGYSIKEYIEQFVGNYRRYNAKIKKGQNFCEICGLKL